MGTFYDELPYPINPIINEKFFTCLQKVDVLDTLGTRVSYFKKWINDQCLNLQKQHKMKKSYLPCWDTLHQWGNELKKRTKRKFYKKKSFNKQRGKKYWRKYCNKPRPKRQNCFRKSDYLIVGKNMCKG